MKNLFLAVTIVGMVGVFGSVHAGNLASRYRGTSVTEFQKFEQRATQRSPRSSLFRRQLPSSMQRGIRTVKTTKAVRRTGIGLRSNNEKVVVSTQRDARKLVSIPAIQFWAEVSEGFAAQPTDISWEKGTARFVRGDEWIELVATGQRCDGGSFYAQTCLRYFADDARAVLKKEFPSARVINNERITRDGTYGARFFQKTNMGWWFLQDSGDSRDGVLTFFDPVNEYVWQLRIHSSGQTGKFLADARNWTLLFESLFKDPTLQKSSSRNTLNYVRRTTER